MAPASTEAQNGSVRSVVLDQYGLKIPSSISTQLDMLTSHQP